MDAPMAGIVTTVFALLLSKKLGWNPDPARILVLVATVLFALALFLPTIGAVEQAPHWILAGHVATALGGLALVIAILHFERRGKSDPQRPRAARDKGTSKKKQATAPPPAPTDMPPPDPDDPYAGPHGDTA